MEGTAKIGLSNDGPSLYIDVVDNLLFGGNKHAGKKCAVGCEWEVLAVPRRDQVQTAGRV